MHSRLRIFREHTSSPPAIDLHIHRLLQNARISVRSPHPSSPLLRFCTHVEDSSSLFLASASSVERLRTIHAQCSWPRTRTSPPPRSCASTPSSSSTATHRTHRTLVPNSAYLN
ncbi:hypothetical protein AcV7_002484 [Taiwanofungus camphoratus]|nr:hypothetical protein AcV7_002484 [Antrodia cinnamomea]